MKLKAMDPKIVKRLIDEGKALLVDVREAGEYAQEHIDGAQLVPLSRFGLEDFSADRDQAAVFYCRSGARTRLNAELLASTGFREAYELTGGIMGWKAAGLPTQEGGGGKRRFGGLF
jgi:rhodanese-related sulfurtransferase